jgi:hypothetical protein
VSFPSTAHRPLSDLLSSARKLLQFSRKITSENRTPLSATAPTAATPFQT